MSYDFTGKVVVVAGGTGFLGQAVVDLYVAAGARVIVPDQHLPREGRANPAGEYLTLDALDEGSVALFFEQTISRAGKIDVLVNVIGGFAMGDAVKDIKLDLLQEQLDLNLKTTFLLTKYALQSIKEPGGKIVHVASRAAIDKGANSFAYSVSKLGVIRLVEAAGAETRDKGININAVMPSIIDTPANRQAMPKADYSKWPRAEQIARVIAFLASDDAELISGVAIPVYGRS